MQEIQKWLAERQYVYSLLAALYQGDITNGMHAFKSKGLLQQFAENFDCAPVRNGARQLIRELDGYKSDRGYEVLIAEDYNRLFTGRGHLLAPPSESAYLAKGKLLFDDPEAAVSLFYKSFGLVISANPEPADHIALELAFMARLCTLAITEQRRIVEILTAQQAFLEVHLLSWVPLWTDDISANARTAFWRGLAALTLGWLENDLIEVRTTTAFNSGLQDSSTLQSPEML